MREDDAEGATVQGVVLARDGPVVRGGLVVDVVVVVAHLVVLPAGPTVPPIVPWRLRLATVLAGRGDRLARLPGRASAGREALGDARADARADALAAPHRTTIASDVISNASRVCVALRANARRGDEPQPLPKHLSFERK